MFKGSKIVCMEDEQKNVEVTYFLKASYFVLPMPALHSFVVPYPRESDLETERQEIYIYFVVHRAMRWWLFCLWGSRPLCKEELLSLAWWRGGGYQHVSWKGTIWSWHELASAKQRQWHVSATWTIWPSSYAKHKLTFLWLWMPFNTNTI